MLDAWNFWAALAGLFAGVVVADLYALDFYFALTALLIAVALWLTAGLLKLGVPYFRTFP